MPNKEQHKTNIRESCREAAIDLLDEYNEEKTIYDGTARRYHFEGKALQQKARSVADYYREANAKYVDELNALTQEMRENKFKYLKNNRNYRKLEDVKVLPGDTDFLRDKKKAKRYDDCHYKKYEIEISEKAAKIIDKVETKTDMLTIEKYKEVADKYEKLSGWSKWWAKRLPASWYSKADLYAEKCAYEEVLTEYGYKPEEVRKDDYVFESAVKPYDPDAQPEKERITVSEVEKGNQIEKTEMIGDVAPVNEKEIEGVSVGGQNA